jgi:hypothetical protein
VAAQRQWIGRGAFDDFAITSNQFVQLIVLYLT